MLGLSAGFGIILAGYTSIIILYIIDRFGFTQSQLGGYILFIGTFLIFNQFVMVPRFVKKFGDLKTFIIGILLLSVGFIAITLTYTLWLYTVLYYILNLGISLLIPTSKSLVSKSVRAEKQGEVLGLDESLKSASNAIIPLVMGVVYGSITYRSFYLLTAVAVALFLIFFFSKSRKTLANH